MPREWVFLIVFKHRFSLADDRADLGRFSERASKHNWQHCSKGLDQSAILRVSTLIDKIREIEIHEYYLIKVGNFIYPNTLFEQNLDNIKVREKPSQ